MKRDKKPIIPKIIQSNSIQATNYTTNTTNTTNSKATNYSCSIFIILSISIVILSILYPIEEISTTTYKTKSTTKKSNNQSKANKFQDIEKKVNSSYDQTITKLMYKLPPLVDFSKWNIKFSPIQQGTWETNYTSPKTSNDNSTSNSYFELNTSIGIDNNYFLKDLISSYEPIYIPKVPELLSSWDIFTSSSWDLLNLMKIKSFMLVNTKIQLNDSTLIYNHEREKGGMLGSKKDRPIAIVDVPMKQFLNSVLDNTTYLIWKGELDVFEALSGNRNASTGTSEKNYNDGWKSLRFVENGLEKVIDYGNTSLWKPFIILSHPGVVDQLQFNQQHNMYVQIFGKTTIQLFPPDNQDKLFFFPNIHRSYRQSQLILSEENMIDRLNTITTLSNDVIPAKEVHMSPGDLLYIPSYWSYRIESHTLSMSLNVMNPSIVDSSLAKGYWQEVPLGVFTNHTSHRVTAIFRYMGFILQDSLTFHPTNLQEFARNLYFSRYSLLYPPKFFDDLVASNSISMKLCSLLREDEIHILEGKYRQKVLERNGDDASTVAIDEELIDELQDEAKELFADSIYEVPDKHKLFELILRYDLKIYEASQGFNNIVDSTPNVPHILGIKTTFVRDYIEQLVRWAVGPEKTPFFIYKCLAEL